MKVKILNGKPVNVWESHEELTRRQNQAKEVSRRIRMDAAWTNRLIQLAQSISGTHWQLVKKLPKKKLQEVIEHMMKDGFPADVPYDQQAVVVSECLLEEKG